MRHVLVGLLTLVFCSIVRAQDWPQWRGPNFDGSSSARRLPDTLDPQKNRAWSLDLPGTGASTPIVLGDRVFLTVQQKDNTLTAIAISKSTGKTLWTHDFSGGRENRMANLSSPSAVAEGKQVIFYFGSGDLAAFDLDGTLQWQRNIQKDFGAFNLLWLYASSPLLYDGKLYIEVLQRDVPISGPAGDTPADSYLLAIDPKTGKDLFRVVRPSDALSESHEAYTTPLPVPTPHGVQIVIIGGDCVTGHDPQTGKELWRCGGYNTRKDQSWRTVASVGFGDGLIFACPPKGGTVFAINPQGAGDLSTSGVTWRDEKIKSDVCVPLFYEGALYVLNGDARKLYKLEPKTGKLIWQGELPAKPVCRASPTGADGKIYLMNEVGQVFVVDAGDTFKIISSVKLGTNARDRARASITVTDGMVFVRAPGTLYAFGGEKR